MTRVRRGLGDFRPRDVVTILFRGSAMSLRSRFAVASIAFLVGCGADAMLWITWTAICHEGCAIGMALPSLAFVLALPFASAGVAAWACAGSGAVRRALPATCALVLMAVALTVATIFARGHAHGG
jgi:hypothetical protein